MWCAKLTINEFPVVDGHPTDTPNELEVTEVVLTASPCVRVDLEDVVVAGGERGEGGVGRRDVTRKATATASALQTLLCIDCLTQRVV